MSRLIPSSHGPAPAAHGSDVASLCVQLIQAEGAVSRGRDMMGLLREAEIRVFSALAETQAESVRDALPGAFWGGRAAWNGALDCEPVHSARTRARRTRLAVEHPARIRLDATGRASTVRAETAGPCRRLHA